MIWVARCRGWVDQPNARSIHQQPIARLGGVAIFFAAIISMLPVLFVQNAVGDSFRDLGIKIPALLAGSIMMFAMGLYDDLYGLRARIKLLIQLVAAIIVCASGIHIQTIVVKDLFSVDFGFYGYLITIIWIVGITNAVNIIDGLDGLAAGISAIACGVIGVLAVMNGSVVLAVLMLAMLGSLTGFLFFNFSPAKIFMGDCGSLFIGFTIASASVMTASKSYALVGIALPILVLGIPIFDTFFSMLRRFLQRRGVMSPDRSHFHHRLLDMGFSQHQVAIIAYIITLGIAGMGFLLLATRSTASVLVLFSCLLILLLIFRIIGSIRLRETMAGIQSRKALSSQQNIERKNFEEVELHFRRAKDFQTWWQVICIAAEKLDFAKLNLMLTNRDGTPRTLSWQVSELVDSKLLVNMKIPIPDRRSDSYLTLEVWAAKNGSLEAVVRRVTLLARLVEEHNPETLPTCSKDIIQ
ncbi:MAG: undecaprenyl/decaprenyl-phosphate alpha-N-acetylglucosaminyl 1-phosphate transferase [Anaerohalosphaera sp.]|nr:undecaprenyl/decaprenyl-phosphate alpha-N-acetylglucosaminyl 1-phosphate transferase [Anaerohalosphaera sp.]